MNILKIVKMYTEDFKSLRSIAKEVNSNHHTIKRILLKEGVKLNHNNRIRPPISDETKLKIRKSVKRAFSKNGNPNIGRKMSRKSILKNMKNHLKYDVSLDWLDSFENVEKLKLLNKSIGRKRDYEGFTSELYVKFIEKFYSNYQFNYIYNNWIKNKKEKYLKPSLDHIIPKSLGGSLTDLDNLQFLTWFENRCKNNMSIEEWEKIKNNINKYLWTPKK